jgi:hypothetical protein
MLILISRTAGTLMNSAEVNRPPRRPAGVCLQATKRGSVLKISGLPWRANASSTASMSKPASSVIEPRQDGARRVNQSSAAAR